MIEVLAEGFQRVEIVLAQGKSTGRRGGPGIDQGHLYDVIFFFGAADVGTAVLYVDVDLRPVIEMIRVVLVAAAHHVLDDDGIDLDGGHARAAAGDGAHDVDSAPGADNSELAVRPQHVCYGWGGGHQVLFPI